MGQQKVVCRYNIIQNFNTEKEERKRKKSGFFKISYLITGTVAFLLVLRIRITYFCERFFTCKFRFELRNRITNELCVIFPSERVVEQLKKDNSI